MNAYTAPDGSIHLSDIPPVVQELLESIPLHAESDSAQVEARFFPDPIAPEANDPVAEDWKAFVVPDLHSAFLSARQTVAADLRNLHPQEDAKGLAMEIPRAHLDDWLNALNQARLAIAAEFRFEEEDLEEDPSPHDDSPRSLALAQIHFFGVLQEYLVDQME